MDSRPARALGDQPAVNRVDLEPVACGIAHATAAGMPEGRAVDLTIAVHELAANAVEHGDGSGRLRMSVTDRELICQVSDPGTAARTSTWPYEPGHGLWLVRQVADHISVSSGSGGSQVTVAFTMLRSDIP